MTAIRDRGKASATSPALSPFEMAGAWCLGVLLVLGGVLYAGGQLAAVMGGRGVLHAGLADVAGALIRLPRTLGDPAAAWGPDIRPSLPGPVLYYVSLGTVVAALVGAGVAVWRLKLRLDRPRHPLGVKPHAGLAGPQDLRRLRIRKHQPGRITLGRVGGRLVAAEAQASLAVIGPTGSGKTAGFAIPTLLEWAGPVICTSVKTDLVRATIRHRSSLGKAWVFDPSLATATKEIPTGLGTTWSPLGTCSDWGGAIRMAEWLCEAAQPGRDTVTDKDYWYTQACKALGPHLHAAALSGRTMRDVLRWVDRQEQEPVREALCRDAGILGAVEQAIAGLDGDEIRRQIEPRIRAEVLDAVRQVLRADPGRRAELAEQRVAQWPIEMQEQYEQRVAAEIEVRVRQAIEARVTTEARDSGLLDAVVTVEALWMQEERLRGSVYATIQNVLHVYADPMVAAATAGCDIDLEEWLSGRNTIYVVATSFEQGRLRPILTVLVQQAIRQAYMAANAAGGTLPIPCLLLLDEAGNIAPLADLPAYASTARSHGISLVTAWQDLSQIQSIYGERANTVLNNHRAKIFGSEISDRETLQYVSSLAGDVEYTERSYSGDMAGGRRNVSEHTTLRPALPPDMIRRIPTGEAILVYGGELPARLRLRPWYKDRRLRKLGVPIINQPAEHDAAVRQLPQNAEAA